MIETAACKPADPRRCPARTAICLRTNKTAPVAEKIVFYTGLLCLLLLAMATMSLQAAPRNSNEFPLTDFKKHNVDLNEIIPGGPPRDGIPPVDAPQFIGFAEADSWLADNEPVIAFENNGEAKAYPLQILMFHEIVNDAVGGEPVAVTFCPLCNASIVFNRTVADKVLDFGTTGWLRKSDLVMYDRQTESWWQQLTGEGIVGHYTGQVLEQLPSQIVAYDTFKDAYADGRVLSRETGYLRRYGNNPYAGYDSIDSHPFLFRGDIDPRLPPMERVLSVPGNSNHHLVPLSALENVAVFNTTLGDQKVVVLAPGTALSALDKSDIVASREIPAAAAFSADVDGRTLTFESVDGNIVDTDTGSRWNALGQAVDGKLAGKRLVQVDKGVHFAFAWLAFDPDAEIIRP